MTIWIYPAMVVYAACGWGMWVAWKRAEMDWGICARILATVFWLPAMTMALMFQVLPVGKSEGRSFTGKPVQDDKERTGGSLPPEHFNCRCDTSPINPAGGSQPANQTTEEAAQFNVDLLLNELGIAREK